MPIYEYQCGCGRVVEDLRKASEADARCVCPDCGKPMKRKLSAHAGVRMGKNSGPACGDSCRAAGNCEMPNCEAGACGWGG